MPVNTNQEYAVHVFNGADRNPSHAASQGFIDAIFKKIQDGRGFIPIVGAGFSVTAGIPIINQLLNYLQRCICIALGAEMEPTGIRSTEIWNPRTDQWPPFIDRKRTRPSKHWINRVEVRLKREVDLYVEQKSGYKKGEDAWTGLYQEGLGAMAEWRTALNFLSRLVLIKNPDGTLNRTRPSLGVPDQDVVDACFREVMRRKRPTLNHRMLASVSGLLRVDLILTTNFDGLIEEAFEETRDALEIFDVHMGDALPAFTAVCTQRSIVKMHGSQRSLRADYSLDGSPRHEDFATFCDYIAGKKPTDNETDPKTNNRPSSSKAKNHLLIAGVGGNECRTFEFMMEALRRFKDLEIFWIAYSDHEISNIKAYFTGDSPGPYRDEKKPRIHVLRHRDAGQLFLHLYQSFRKSLPSDGSIFPSITRLSFPPLPWQGHNSIPGADVQIDALEDQLKAKISALNANPDRIFIVPGKRNVYGVCTAAARLYRKLERDNICIWIDMNDVYSADNLFEAFQEAAFQRLGEVDWTPLYIQKDEETIGEGMPLRREIARIIQSSNRPWILFLDAREIPGSNQIESSSPNGWMDDSPDKKPKDTNKRKANDANGRKSSETNDSESFIRLLLQFALANPRKRINPKDTDYILDEEDERTLRVVVLCNHNDSGQGFLKSLDDIPKEKNPRRPGSWREQFHPFRLDEIPVPPLPLSKTAQKVAEDVIEWTCEGDRKDRQRFVQTLVSMQRPRHLAVAWAKCTQPRWTLSNKTDTKRKDWLDELAQKGLLRRMDGGFIWFQAKFRQALRHCLQLTLTQLGESEISIQGADPFALSQQTVNRLKMWNAPCHQAEIHLGLTTWYRKVFDATGAAPAILEAVDHLCESSKSLLIYKDSTPDHGLKILDLAADRMAAARELLREFQFLIQSQGHPRASLRRLRMFQDFWAPTQDSWASKIEWSPDAERLKTEVLKFQSTVAELCRVIFREIGEDGEAYDRMRDLAIYMTEKNVISHEGLDTERKKLKKKKAAISLHVTQALIEANPETPQRRYSDKPKRMRELIRWWRWCGMLALWSRSHKEASRSLGRAIYIAKEGAKFEEIVRSDPKALGPDDPNLETQGVALNFQGWKLNKSDGHKSHLEVMHSLELSAYCLLLRAHTRARELMLQSPFKSPEDEQAIKGTEDSQGSETIRSLQKLAEKFALKGLEFVEQVQNDGEPSEDHDLELLWCKSRLLMVAGLASEHVPSSKQGRHAMSMLSDAAACLKRTTLDRGRSDLSLIEMRRAEVRLQEAARRKIVLDVGGRPDRRDAAREFEAWIYDRLLGGDIDQPVSLSIPEKIEAEYLSPIQSVADLRKSFETEKDQAEIIDAKKDDPNHPLSLRRSLRIVKARTSDALRYLDRAEPILRDRRRNVWWTTWYFERRLRALSILLWISTVEIYQPIPFLGLEAAMDGTETEPDLLLDDALRMVRVDSYRLAMIVLSYASCTRALQIRLRFAPKSEAMNYRLRAMEGKLLAASKQLNLVDKLRNKSAMGKRAPMDQVSRDVITESKTRIGNVLEGLRRELHP